MNELTLYPGQPMRIYSVPPEVEAPGSPWIVQMKKNGHRAIIRCGKDGIVKMYARDGSGELTASKKHDWQWLANFIPAPFVLDGELVGPRQAKSDKYTLCLWDCIRLGAIDDLASAAYTDRMWWTQKIVEGIHRSEPQGQKVQVTRGHEVKFWADYWDVITDPDGEDEGLVFKRADLPLAWHTKPGVEDPNQLKLRKKG